MKLPDRIEAALGWASAHKRVVLPAAFAVLVLANLVLMAATGPLGTFAESQAVDVSGIDDFEVPPGVDEDSDGVSDLTELLDCGTSPGLPDTDHDDVPDAWECRWREFDPLSGTYSPDPLRADAGEDPDHDGLTNLEEHRAGTAHRCLDPMRWDSDGDGLADGYEVASGLDPCAINLPDDDHDGDGLTDFEEAELGTNASRVDTDGDGLGDFSEVEGVRLEDGRIVKPDPTAFSTGGSGVSDGWLIHFGFDPRDGQAAYNDTDGDGLTNLREYHASAEFLDFANASDPASLYGQGLDPTDADRDDDGLPDGWEVDNGLDPLVPADADLDPDGDGLTNLEEFLAGSLPHLADSDGDGLGDLAEVTGRPAADEPARTIDIAGEPRTWKSDPLSIDSDLDGLSDLDEWNGFAVIGGSLVRFCPSTSGDERTRACTLDPLNPDSDLDGLTDREEVTLSIDLSEPLNPLSEDSDGDGLLDGAEVAYWDQAAATADQATLDALGAWRRDHIDGLGSETPSQLREALLPTGDIDGDGIENVVDDDSDDDGLEDGAEVDPEPKEADGGLTFPWPATHPGLVDTDGDGLPDGWEWKWAGFEPNCGSGIWNLDPTKRNSYEDGCLDAFFEDAFLTADDLLLEDGERDLDKDGVHYGEGYAGDARMDIAFTNLQEYEAGTDPNDPDSDDDGVTDGWEVLFTKEAPLLDMCPVPGCNEGDVNRTMEGTPFEKSYHYRRYVTWPEGDEPPPAREGETLVLKPWGAEVARSVDGDDIILIAYYEGTYTLTLREQAPPFEVLTATGKEIKNSGGLGTNPLVADSDGDGMSDVWEAYWSRESGGGVEFSPVSDAGADADTDEDGLTNLREYLLSGDFDTSTSPLAPDTDHGGIPDGEEVDGDLEGLDPLRPTDDDRDGDADHDGLTNFEELDPTALWGDGTTGCTSRGTCLSITDPDSDNDGLLDGPDRVLSRSGGDAAAVDFLLSHGVIHTTDDSDAYTFYGELAGDLAMGETNTDPTDWDSDDDGLPDGWERYYFVIQAAAPNPTIARTPSNSVDDDADGLDNREEYGIGRPDTWNEALHGVWWFGGNPIDRNTDGDPANERDGTLRDGETIVGVDLDHDNDGLNDFNGEDPYPFFDHANTGDPDPLDPAFVRAWVFEGGRRATATENVDGDTPPDMHDHVLADVSVTTPGQDLADLEKGGTKTIAGRVTVKGSTPPEGIPGVLVVVNLRAEGEAVKPSANPSEILGLGYTDADGYFSIDVVLTGERAVTLGARTTGTGTSTTGVVFGAVVDLTKEVKWELNTTRLAPGTGYTFVAWSYGVGYHEEAHAIEADCFYHEQPNCVEGNVWTFEGVGGTFESFWNDGTPGRTAIKSPTRIVFDDESFSVDGGVSFTTSGRVVDGAGDPISGRDVRLEWRDTSAIVTSDDAGAFAATFEAGDHETPVVLQLSASTPADAARGLGPAEATQSVYIAFPTTIAATILNPRPEVQAGGVVEVEVQLKDVLGNALADMPVRVEIVGVGVVNITATDAEGRAGALLPVPTDASVGTYPVDVSFAGTELYQPSSIPSQPENDLRPLVSVRQSTVIAFTVDDGVVGEDLVVEGSLRDQSGKPAHDPQAPDGLRVTLDTPGYANSVVLDGGGNFRFLIPDVVVSSVGTRPVRVFFEGTGFYEATSHREVVNVTSPTTIDITPKRYTRGTTAFVEGAVVDAVGNGVVGVTVSATVGDHAGTGVTRDDGVFSVAVPIPADARTGPVTATARFDGTSFHDAALPAEDRASAILAATTLNVTDRVLPAGVLRLNATLTRDDGTPVGGAELRFILDAAIPISDTAVTNAQGEATVNLEGAHLAALPYTLRATYGGSLLYGGTAATGTVDILARTTLTPDLPTTVVERGSGLLVAGSLLEENGVPVKRGNIVATLNGTRIGTLTTDVRGNFSAALEVPAGLPQAVHPLILTYAGDGNHVPATAAVDVRVLSATIIRVIIPGSLQVGESFTGTILLEDDRGEPVPKALVKVRFSGYHHPFTLETDDEGKAYFPGRITAAGTSDVTVQFPGEGDLAASEKSSEIQVQGQGFLPQDSTEWALVIVVALVIVAVASVLLARFRRRQVRGARRIFADAHAGLVGGNEYSITILHAYKQLVDHLVQYGFTKRPDLTPQEFKNAVRTALPVRHEPLDILIRLFEEARYSQHAIGPAERDEAIAALGAINRDLANAAREQATGGGRREEVA